MRAKFASHFTVDILRQLIPKAKIVGLSFATRLPHPSKIAPKERNNVFEGIKAHAVSQCISALLSAAGLPEMRIGNGPEGERLWPSGFVGSVTHKGTVVLSTIAPTALYSAIGIDLERVEGNEGDLDPNVIAPEGIPDYSHTPTATLLVLSAKEAVFKAQFPTTRRMLTFTEVQLDWRRTATPKFHAVGHVFGGLQLNVSAVIAAPWIITTAVRADQNV